MKSLGQRRPKRALLDKVIARELAEVVLEENDLKDSNIYKRGFSSEFMDISLKSPKNVDYPKEDSESYFSQKSDVIAPSVFLASQTELAEDPKEMMIHHSFHLPQRIGYDRTEESEIKSDFSLEDVARKLGFHIEDDLYEDVREELAEIVD